MNIFAYRLFVAICSLLGFLAQAEVHIADWPNHVKGYIGENLMDEFYTRSGKQELLGKICPTADGPDRIYLCPDGTIEIHEIKYNGEWRGKASLWHDVQGRRMCELSDDWIDQWLQRVENNPWATEKERKCAQLVRDAQKSGKLVRVFDELNYAEGKFRSFRVHPNGGADVLCEDLQGPLRIEKFLAKAQRLKNEYAQARVALKDIDRKLLSKPEIVRLPENPQALEDYLLSLGVKSSSKIKICPAALLSDGRLFVAAQEAGLGSALVISVDGGIATYQYVRGDIWKPELKQKLADAAIKGTTVGSATAVAVVFGVSPGGIVILAVAAGAYLAAETALNSYHEAVERHFVTVDDLRHYGHELRSSIAEVDVHASENDLQHFGHHMTP